MKVIIRKLGLRVMEPNTREPKYMYHMVLGSWFGLFGSNLTWDRFVTRLIPTPQEPFVSFTRFFITKTHFLLIGFAKSRRHLTRSHDMKNPCHLKKTLV